MYLYIILVESLHGAIPAVMEQDHEGNDFTDREFWLLFGWITQDLRSKSVMEVKTKGVNLAPRCFGAVILSSDNVMGNVVMFLLLLNLI